jgi:pimeloyl-ACP methyl ester carboxylesterase
MRSSHVSTSSGTSLYVEDTGSGPVVLALHGLGGGAYFFRALGPRLEPRYRTIAVDLPGTGRSRSGLASFTVDTWVRDLGDLVHAKSDRPVVIVGHSFGTILALKAYAAWPHLIRGLVFVGGLPAVRPPIRERLSQRANAVRQTRDLTGWGEKVAPGVFSPASLRARPELIGMFERLFEAQSPEAYVRCADLLLGCDAAAILPTVTVPTVAVTGADDQYAPPDDVRGFMAQVPGGRGTEVIPECGHLPFFESIEAFTRIVGRFLDSVGSGPLTARSGRRCRRAR